MYRKPLRSSPEMERKIELGILALILMSDGIVPPEVNFTVETQQCIYSPFTLLEFDYPFRDKKRHLPCFKDALLKVYNKALVDFKIPKQWKTTKILPFLKPGKNPDSIDSYRPIALNSCIAKLLELMVKNRIEWDLENRHWVPDEQLGFRKGKGCVDCLAHLCLEVQIN